VISDHPELTHRRLAARHAWMRTRVRLQVRFLLPSNVSTAWSSPRSTVPCAKGIRNIAFRTSIVPPNQTRALFQRFESRNRSALRPSQALCGGPGKLEGKSPGGQTSYAASQAEASKPPASRGEDDDIAKAYCTARCKPGRRGRRGVQAIGRRRRELRLVEGEGLSPQTEIPCGGLLNDKEAGSPTRLPSNICEARLGPIRPPPETSITRIFDCTSRAARFDMASPKPVFLNEIPAQRQ